MTREWERYDSPVFPSGDVTKNTSITSLENLVVSDAKVSWIEERARESGRLT